MKVLLINTFFPPTRVGGAEESVAELASDLLSAGHQVAVACLAPMDFAAAAAADDIAIYRWRTHIVDPYFASKPSSRISKLVWHLGDLRRRGARKFLRAVIAKEKPDIIHCNAVSGFGLEAWAASQGIPLVHTLRDFYLACVPGKTYRDGKNCERACTDCKILRAPFHFGNRPDAFVSISEDTLERHREFGAIGREERATVIHNSPSAEGIFHERSRAGSEYVLGYIGRVEDYKGINVVLDALELIPDPDVRLLIAGDGESALLDQIRERARLDTRIRYMGRMVKQEFYASVDLVLVPSQWHEPYGRVAAEAAIGGKDVLISGVGGLPEAVSVVSNYGVVSDFTQPSAWAAKILEVRALGDRLDGSVTAHNRTPVIEQYLNVYESLLYGSPESDSVA